jgi:hypothetical protein
MNEALQFRHEARAKLVRTGGRAPLARAYAIVTSGER